MIGQCNVDSGGITVVDIIKYSKNNRIIKSFNQYIAAIFGTFMYAVGVNIFIVPFGLYSGGFVGIAQVIRTICVSYLHINFGDVDIAGIIYFLMNVPLFFMAFRVMGKHFFFKTLITVISQTFFLTIVKIPVEPIVEDILTSCLIGGICCGIGTGIVLRVGSSGGGCDILGIFFSKKYRKFSVGKLTTGINLFIYLFCAALFDIEIAIYSIIYTAVNSIVIDKIHVQNINMTAMIFTKKRDLEGVVLRKLNRGVTYWDGKGAYTNTDTMVMVTVISKYEVGELKKVIEEEDPKAFIILNEGIDIMGNFEKRL